MPYLTAEIYTSKDQNEKNKLCSFRSYDIATTTSCLPLLECDNLHFCLNNLIRIENIPFDEEIKKDYNGVYFIDCSLIDADSYEVFQKLISYNKQDIILYLYGISTQEPRYNNPNPPQLIFKKDGKEFFKREIIFVPRTTQDYFSKGDKVYKCDKIYYLNNGDVEVNVTEEGNKERFKSQL